MGVELAEWINRLKAEYLAQFIPSGGAAVRVVVAPEADRERVMDAVERAAKEDGYFVASVDASQVRAYRIDHIFHRVAANVEWQGAVDRQLRKLFDENGIKVPESWPLHDIDRIADANGRIPTHLLGQIERLLTSTILRDYRLCREFRTAVAMLCRAVYNPRDVACSDAETIELWLRGEKCALAALKKLQIYQRIGRHNARLMLNSLALWLHEVGYAGLALLMNLNAVVRDAAMGDEQVRYTRGTALDTYELLRQFIDGTDEVRHFLMVAVVGRGFLDHPKRNFEEYLALKWRLVDEVHERNYRNPLNVMIRVDPSAVNGGMACEGMP